MSDLPIKNCYWVTPGRFLAGEYPRDMDEASSQEKVAALVGSGVQAFIDLTQEYEGLKPYAYMLEPYAAQGVTHQRFPIRDVSVPKSIEQAAQILDAIDGHLWQGRMVYVHCWGGVGRTGVVVGCWLARQTGSGQSALAELHDLWRQCPKSAYRRSPETWEQENYIRQWRERRA